MRNVKLILPADIKTQTGAYPPLGLGYISSYFKSQKVHCEIIDLSFDTDFSRIENILGQDMVYGITCTTAFYPIVKEITKIIKKNDPAGTVCLGGAHPTALPELCLKDDKNTDVIVIGEGEYTMYDIVQNYHKSPDSIKGIYYRDRVGNIIKTEPREPISDLDKLPFPDQSAFPIEEYFQKKGYRELTMVTSRGCPNDCVFCQPTLHKMFGKKTRFRSAENVVDEMEWMVRRFDLDLIVFSDDTFTLSKKHTIEVCQEIIRRNLNILWRVQTRVTTDRETMQIMKKAGCFLMAFGVESGSEAILNNIHKKITIKQITDAFDTGKEVGILTYAFLMVGNEGESEQTISETLKLIKRIKPYSGHVAITTPYPGTHCYNSLKIINPDWSKYIHIADDTVMFGISTLSPENILKGKRAVESALTNNAKKIRDIINLLKDGIIIKILIRMSIKDMTFPVRAAKLFLYSIQKQGFRIINPKYSEPKPRKYE
ncbi:MAG: radical SAM protein [Nitrospirota bacterium]|nr:radical SAM protein [Nitrospirota bacterium]